MGYRIGPIDGMSAVYWGVRLGLASLSLRCFGLREGGASLLPRRGTGLSERVGVVGRIFLRDVAAWRVRVGMGC
jgi:hypothetical protein